MQSLMTPVVIKKLGLERARGNEVNSLYPHEAARFC
jgi:hypothetical protein